MYVVHRGKIILSVTDKLVTQSDPLVSIFKVSEDLSSLKKEDILKNYIVWDGRLVERGSYISPSELKIAFVGVYLSQCGIATYSEAIYPEVAKYFKEYKIFSEFSEEEHNGDIDQNIIRCWKRGKPLVTLIDEIHKYNPDIVLIQHEYGIFPVASHWLSFMSEMQKYKTFVSMHSVYTHKDKTVFDASMPNIIVHTQAGYDVLTKIKKLQSNVNIIPHFCKTCADSSRFYNCYHTEHTIVQFGFGFKYKGWEQSIQIINILKDEFPDIFFTGLFSESKFSASLHDQYYLELNDEINRLGLTKHIGIIRGYQSDESLESYLRTNRVALFPYVENVDHTVFGCSGAARLAMSKGIPTLVSKAPLFDDLEGVCPRSNTIEEFCNIIRSWFKDWKLKKAQIETQNKFLNDNTIELSAKRYVEVMTKNGIK